MANKKDWRGEKGKYYDYGFEDGKKQALEEVEKVIDSMGGVWVWIYG